MKRLSRSAFPAASFVFLAVYAAQLPAARGASQNAALFAPLRALAAYLGLAAPVAPRHPAQQSPVRLAKAAGGSGGLGTKAVTFLVNNPGDQADGDPRDNSCDTDLTTTGSQCTLRAAIQQANATPGADIIQFAISGPPGVQIIPPTSALPALTEAVTLDGSTQGGFSGTPLVFLDGSDAGSAVTGLRLSAPNCTIKSLAIGNFTGTGIATTTNTATGNTIQGCYIGIAPDGSTARPNAQGIQLNSISNIIGGAAAGDGNVISGNTGLGLGDTGDGSANPTGNTIQGNIIGLSANQSTKVPNNIGLQISSRDNDIVGAVGAGRNIIAGNTTDGIDIFQNFAAGNDNNIIQGNKIGTNDSFAVLGNGGDGIFMGGLGDQILSNTILGNGGNGITLQNATGVVIQQNNIGFVGKGNTGSGVYFSNGAKNNVVGGDKTDNTPGPEGNLIAGNLTGVSVFSGASDATGNTIRGNTIEQNTKLGINLNGDGNSGDAVTPNDDDLTGPNDDADTGNNNLQNYPKINAIAGNNIIGEFHSTPNTSFILDFYDNAHPDANGFGEGETLLTSQPVTTDANGDVNFSFGGTTFTGSVTSTATNQITGDTSEFSNAFSRAKNFVVDTTSDANLTACTATAGDCSLRGAINAANSNSGADTISFAIPGTGVQTINPTASLPTLNDSVTIDGTTQTGYAGTPLVVLNGAVPGGAGLTINNVANCTINALGIGAWNGGGIVITGGGATGNTVKGCYIGVDSTGNAALPNGDGVSINNGATGNTIGGTTAAARNIISGNNGVGVHLDGGATTGNTISGNYIGTNATGTASLANVNSAGVYLSSSASNNTIGGTTGTTPGGACTGACNLISGNGQQGINMFSGGQSGNIVQGNFVGTNAAGKAAIPNANTGVYLNSVGSGNAIGGSTPAARNLISGNNSDGIAVQDYFSLTAGTVIRGNYIGTDTSGTLALANGNNGIYLAGINTKVGGVAPADGTAPGNLIAFNQVDGIDISGPSGPGTTTGTAIRGNSIHDNGGIGIDLNSDGLTANDTGDDDSGANGLQNYPVITSVTAGSNSVVKGTLNSSASTAFTIDLYSNNAADPSGFGEGQTYIGSTTATTNGSGNANFTATLPGVNLTGAIVTATATDPGGNSSEFSSVFAPPQALIVDTTSDANLTACTAAAGDCSLRGAINDANGGGGSGTISFNIPGTGVKTIALTGTLPSIQKANITLDATTQPGYAGKPLIFLDGTNTLGGYGLQSNAAGVKIKGFAIGNCGNGIAISLGASNNVVQSCYLGTDAAGSVARPNDTGILVTSAVTNTLIGGITAGQGNLISGNTSNGVDIRSTGTTGTVLQGNFIGTNAAGSADLGNTGAGIIIQSGASSNTVGGTAATARNIIAGNDFAGVIIDGTGTSGNHLEGNFIGLNINGNALGNGAFGPGVSIQAGASSNVVGGTVTGTRNVISGHTNGTGVVITGAGSSSNLVQGNYIGLNAAGTAALANSRGVSAVNGATGNTIGGTTVAARNVISGCEFAVGISDAGTSGNKVQGNYLGLNAAGTAAIANRFGVGIAAGAAGNTVGGTTATTRNVISGNTDANVYFSGAGANTVSGNYLGTTPAGTAALGSGFTTTASVWIDAGSSGEVIGGTAGGAGNVISGSGGNGVLIQGNGATDTTTKNNRVQGNFIGTDAAGTGAVRNAGAGVVVHTGAKGNIIGGTGTGAANVIANNGGAGVIIADSGSTGNSVRGNRVSSNTGIGIDLGNDGVTANDAGDSDTGANNLQNYPVLTSAVSESGGTRVKGSLNGPANALYTIDFFDNTAADPSGFGEGQKLLLSLPNFSTASTGTGPINVLVPTAPDGHFVSATATSASGDTSEFSRTVKIGAVLPVLSISDVSVTEGNSGTTNANFTVTLSAAASGTVTVNYATANGTATAPGDYTAKSGTLTFAAGATSRTISVPVIGDSAVEPNETFFVNLTAPTGATIADAQGIGTIVNDDSAASLPTLTINNQSLNEGDSGQTAINFIVTLSAASASPVTVRYSTAPGTVNPATGGTATTPGADYVSVTNALLTIPAGQTSAPLAISALGDKLIEPDETFFVNLSSPTGATIADGRGVGTIRNDDVPANFVVDTASDADLGTCSSAPGDCSLRGAIRRANADPALQTIGFAIPGSGVPTITLGLNALVIRQPVTIDGFSQNPGLGQPAVHIDSDVADYALDVQGNGSLIKGLIITKNEEAAIRITGDNNQVQGCWIGGSGVLANEKTGIELSGGATGNLIGGSGAARNLISGNRGTGVVISGSGTSGNRVQGNYIGTTKDGVSRLANGIGISIASGASGNLIGGATAGSGNLIAGNTQSGVEVSGNGNSVLGNTIGLNKNSASLPNGGSGINVLSGSGSVIGTVGSGANTIRFNGGAGISLGNGVTSAALRGNVISNNTGDGVRVSGTAKGVTIRSNQHKRNGKLGINLVGGTESTAGVTTNDTAANDADSGANNLQNYPAISDVAQAGVNERLLLKGSLRSTPNRAFLIDVYASQAQDPSRFGEGETALGVFSVQTNAAGAVSFVRALTLPAALSDARNQYITLTATDDTTGDTSEFSFAKQVPATFTAPAVEPGTATLQPCQGQQFAATLAGIPFADVIWSVTDGSGGAAPAGVDISQSGVFTSSVEGTFIVTATSKLTPSVKASATVTVTSITGFFGWGHNSAGSVGDGTTSNKLVPVPISLPSTPTVFAAGGTHSLAVASGKLFAWGQNSDYQLGLGDNNIRTTPTQVTAIDGSKVTALACGWYHSLAVVGGEVYAWGYNRYGQCGQTPGTSDPHILAPTKVPGLSNVVEVSAGIYFSLARKSDGTVWAWGSSLYGQCGPAASAVQVKPVKVTLAGSATRIGAGAAHSAALIGGQVYAWGLNETGQLGNGQQGTGLQSATPVRAGTLTGMTLLAVGYAHTLAGNATQTYSWGDNGKNQLGRNGSTGDPRPGLIAGLSGVTRLAAGSVHNLAVKSDGTLWSWGYGPFGSLGLGDTSNRATPQQVTAVRGASEVAAGYAHSFAIAKQDLCAGGTPGGTPGGISQAPQAIAVQAFPSSGTAWSSSDSIALDLGPAGNATRFFRVSVNGRDVEVQGVQTTKDGTTLLLPTGTLKAGDKVVVSWNSLSTTESQSITLHAE